MTYCGHGNLVGEAREGAVELAAAREVEQGGGPQRLRVDLAYLGVGLGLGLRGGGYISHTTN